MAQSAIDGDAQSELQRSRQSALVDAFEGKLDLRDDELHRRLYAQDASIFEEEPAGVVYPRSTDEVRRIVETAAELNMPLIPRGGGTSLAGQVVGEGLVVGTGRHMSEILEVNADEGWARVQPGVVLDQLNEHVGKQGLIFGPDTSTSSRCQIGGMVGNNSCGAHSVYYGTTRDHVLEMEVVFSDGTVETVGSWSDETLSRHLGRDDRLGEALRALEEEVDEHAEEIRDAYPHPDLIRRNTGYPFDAMLGMLPFDQEGSAFSLAPFLCGTEGTLGIVTEIKVNLEPKPTHNLLVCAHFESLAESLNATVEAVENDPSAVELMDKRIMDLTKGHPEHQKHRFFVEGDPGAILVIEYYGHSEEEVERKAQEGIQALKEAGYGYAYPKVYPPRDAQVWKLRKEGLGLLMGIQGDTKPVTLVEDTAVPVWSLPDYARDFGQIMEKYDTRCVYYAHASVGELHLRPELNLKSRGDAEKFREIAGEVTDLVKQYGGALSGEHGDGRLRSPMLEQFYGEEIMGMHARIKEAFDPQGIFNPGKIVDPEAIDADWRVTPGESAPEFDTAFDWSDDQGFLRSVEKCNGAGVCRQHEGEGRTMCPSYMATREEKDSTRGRANVLRQLLRGDQPGAAFESEAIEEAMDLCLSCKACKTECPASVDMARMKAEVANRRHQKTGGPSRSAALFGRFAQRARLASYVAWLVNLAASFFLVRWIIDAWYGLASQRELPQFRFDTFSRKWRRHVEQRGEHQGRHGTVWLYVDPFTEYTEPEVGMDAVRVLEAAGWTVEPFMVEDDGRTHISKGLLDEARELSNANMQQIADALREHPDRRVVGLEPSALLTFRDETLDLVDDQWREVAKSLADRARLFEEFVMEAAGQGAFDAEWARQPGSVELHGHCHQKALVGNEPTERALKYAGFEVETIPSGCCGMAGSFGYEADHYDVSMAIGELVLFPAVRDAGEDQQICAPGTSCRDQIAHGTDAEAHHPATLLRRALA
jgi:FAD/FMN-containing dehydrogenase/Fe-S oxidoreductase